MKRRMRKFVVAVCLLAVLAGGFLICHTREMRVEGSGYYGEETIASWISKEPLSSNTLYLFLRYHFTSPKLPAGIERMEVDLVNPWTVRVTVTDKERLGYVDYDGAYLYFGARGEALFRTKKVLEGVPYVQGLSYDAEKVKIGEQIPVEHTTVFDDIKIVSDALKQAEIAFEQLKVDAGQIVVTSGNIRIRLGGELYEERVALLPTILKKLSETAANTGGELHMERYSNDNPSISFVPDEKTID